MQHFELDFTDFYYKYYSECGNMGTTVGGWYGDKTASILTKFLFQSFKIIWEIMIYNKFI